MEFAQMEESVNTSNDQVFSDLRNRAYSSAALDVDQDQTITQVERAMPVRLIATLEDLITTDPNELAIQALEKVELHDFDYLPVRVSETGLIVGIVSAE